VTPGTAPLALVVMGVSGCGKSTIASMLAGRLGWPYIEGDDLHPPANIEKMKAGTALDDTDRAPWLAAIATEITGLREQGQSCIVTCSALKRRYRQAISGDSPQVCFIYLHGSRDLIAQRLAHRLDHFMPASLLDSQFAALEEPGPDENAIRIEIGRKPADAVAAILAALKL
jgi:gluconokinase